MVKSKPPVTPPGKGVLPLLFSSGATWSEFQFWTLAVLLLAFVVAVSYCNIRSLDLWWHLKTGEWVWQHRSVPSSDPFSYSAAGKPWISHEWLFAWANIHGGTAILGWALAGSLVS